MDPTNKDANEQRLETQKDASKHNNKDNNNNNDNNNNASKPKARRVNQRQKAKL